MAAGSRGSLFSLAYLHPPTPSPLQVMSCFCHVVKCMCLCAEVFFLFPHCTPLGAWSGGCPFPSPLLMLCCYFSLNLATLAGGLPMETSLLAIIGCIYILMFMNVHCPSLSNKQNDRYEEARVWRE